jgi:NAD(P)-dependent dehydrogenase (short-subunit alcohol dehydrogenase family)
MRLKGKVALITGGGSGIGRQSSLLFAREGAEVLVVDMNDAAGNETVEMIKGAGGRAAYSRADVSKAADCSHMVATAEKAFGKLDVLFNNAGIMHAQDDDAVATDEAIWDLTLDVNAKGVFLGCQVFGKYLVERGQGGSIINLGSMSGVVPLSRVFTYSATKGAVHNLSLNLAREWAPHKVRVNCIQPGIVEGERVERIMAAKAEGLGISKEEVRKRMVEGVSLKTTVTAQDVANTALFLASDAGKHISGQAISVCGGVRYLV